jgi:pimeloyl-ACP methyl ester carboxylesterase
MKKVRLGIVLICLLMIGLCQTDMTFNFNSISANEQTLPAGEQLVSVQKVSTFSKSGIHAMLFLTGLNDFRAWMHYPFTIYRITYQTTFKEEKILASGLVCVPEGVEEAMPIVSAQHGTIFADKDAPSAFHFPGRMNEYALMASVGYITFIPDYIGFGASAEIVHPYYNYDYSSTAVIDMLKAGKEMLELYEINYEPKLFLVGYSEGGYVTMATHRQLEQGSALGLELVASAAGAGSYDLVGVMEKVLQIDSYQSPSLLCYVIHSYNVINDWGRPLLDFFQDPYFEEIPELFSGEFGKKFIDKHLTKEIEDLFSPTLLYDLMAKVDTQMLEGLYTNSIMEWKNQAPIRLFHSPNDQTIPIEDTEAFYQEMKASGSDIEYFQVEGSHPEAVYPMMQQVLPWFESLR